MINTDWHLTWRGVADDVVDQLVSRDRCWEAAETLGQAMSSDHCHEVATVEVWAVCRVGHVDDHAVDLPKRDDRTVARGVQPDRDPDNAQQHKYRRQGRCSPASEDSAPSRTCRSTHHRRGAHGPFFSCVRAAGKRPKILAGSGHRPVTAG